MKSTTEHTEHTDSANSKPKKGRSPVSIARYVAVWLGLVVLAVFWNLVFPTTGVLGTIGGWLGIAALGMTLVAFLWNLVESVRSLYYLRRVDRRTFWHCIAWIVLGCGATIAFSRWREASRDRAYQEVARFAEIQAKHKPTPATPSPAEEKHAESAENAEPEPHAEPADSPLATALAGGEWIPLVVESVYIDATAPRELRKNWIVSFSGGIKARVHSPVKTFGESYGDLPGKRFGVRFVDRAAALAALHGTVYSGELEVRSAQGPVSAAANAAAAKEAAVRAKLDAIVFDSLEYQDANAADVISDLCERAREMDKDEPDPAKKGVSVVVGVDVKDIDEILARTTVTLKERSVSLGAALDRVADAIGLKVRVVGGCVLLGIYKGPLECRIFPVPPDLASRFLGDGNDWKARLAEIGVEWPDGTYVRYLMSVGRLTVYNTPDDLDLVERALSEATRSPAEDDLTAAVRAKLDRIIVEKVEWQQKNIADAIADLGDFSRQFDPETDIRKRGVGFTLDLGEAPSEADLPRLTVRLHRVTLHSLLDLVADMADLEYRIEGGRVVLRRKDAESAELAASAREEDNDEKVQAFLRRIEEPGVIPELEWRDASVADVAQLLTDCSPILEPGTFEERGGVHFVTDADSEDFPKEAVPRVSCREGEVSLLQAAHLAAEAAGWRATAYPESRAIRIGFSWSCGPVYSMADATPELVAAIERELPAAENPDESARLRSFLAARGVRWSESDEAQLRSDIGKLVFTVAEEDTARLIRAILAAPGFALRRIPVRAKVVSIEGDPTRFGLGGRDSALTIRTLSTEDLAEIAAAFDAGAEVTALEPLQAEEGLPAIWKQVSSPAPGFEALVVLTPAADGEGRRVHFVLRSFPPDADAETVAPHGCAGDAALAPGEALLVGAIPVAGSPDRSLALLLEFPDTQSPEEEKTHAENAEPKPHAEPAEGAE